MQTGEVVEFTANVKNIATPLLSTSVLQLPASSGCDTFAAGEPMAIASFDFSYSLDWEVVRYIGSRW